MPIIREKPTSVRGVGVARSGRGRHVVTAVRAAMDLRAAAMIGAVQGAMDRHEGGVTNVAAASAGAGDGSMSGTVVVASANQGRLRYRARR